MPRDVIKELQYIVNGLCVEKRPGCASLCEGSDAPNCHATKGKPIKY